MTAQSTLSHSPAFDLEQSDSETSNLLRLSTPYIQFDEEEHSQSLEPRHRYRAIARGPGGESDLYYCICMLCCTVIFLIPLFIIYAAGCHGIMYAIYLLHLICGFSLPLLSTIFLIYCFSVDSYIVLSTSYVFIGMLTVLSSFYFSMYYCK